MPSARPTPIAPILAPGVAAYLDRLLPARDPTLQEMERLAAREAIPIIGPGCGRLLALLVQLSRARRIFEMGSAIGYSTLWLARAAGPHGRVFYTDSDPRNAQRAERFLARAGVRERVRLLVGDALELLQQTRGQFDFIFIDVDKAQYPAALALALPRLRPGGLLVADNTLWHGQVAEPAYRDSATRAIRQFNTAVFRHPELLSVIVPLRDGVAVCLKRRPAPARRSSR